MYVYVYVCVCERICVCECGKDREGKFVNEKYILFRVKKVVFWF